MEWLKLTDICRPKQWKTIAGKDLLSKGYPVYGANGIIGYWSAYNHEVETVTIACRGTCGVVNIVPARSYINGNAMCMDDLASSINPRFLYYYLRCYNFKTIITGTTIPQITIEGLKKVKVPVVSLEKQTEIVHLFDTMESIISLRKKEQAALDDLINARFIEMFGKDFSKGIPLKECCNNVCGGGTPSMKHLEYFGGNVPFIKSGDIRGNMVFSGALWLTEKALLETTAKYVPRGSVLVVNRSAALLKEFRVAIAGQPVVINQDIKAFIPNEKYCSQYLLWAIKSQTQYLLSKVTTVLTSHIDLKDLLDLPIVPASIEQQRAFSTFVDLIDKLKVDVQMALDKAQLVYDTMAQKYFR